MRLFPKPTAFLDLAKTMVASWNEFASAMSKVLYAPFDSFHRGIEESKCILGEINDFFG